MFVHKLTSLPRDFKVTRAHLLSRWPRSVAYSLFFAVECGIPLFNALFLSVAKFRLKKVETCLFRRMVSSVF